MPESVEIPAPVSATVWFEAATQEAIASRSVVVFIGADPSIADLPYGMASSSKASFQELQAALVARVARRHPDDVVASAVVVLPSITFPSVELRKITGIQFYEERMLFAALMLRNPELSMVYVTSIPIDQATIDYYLDFLPDELRAHERLKPVAVGNAEPRALTEKILDSSRTMDEILRLVDRPGDAYILPFNVTALELRLAEQLGIALYGPDPELIPLGSKSGARAVAKEAGVPVPAGSEDLYSLEAVGDAIEQLQRARPQATAVVLKLNNGFSGQGNAIVNLRSLRSPLHESPVVFCAGEETWESFRSKIAAEGAVVEELVRVPGTVSPSVQLRIVPGGRVEVLSTHDQILGGPDDQVYLGCRFPASESYRSEIQELGWRAAEILADRGVIGAFGIDFLVVPSEDPGIYLTEINLRVGGTTHPFGMARLATEADYHVETGELVAEGVPKYYVATDNLKDSAYVGLKPGDIIEALEKSGLGFDIDAKAGVTLHLLGAIEEHGKLGATCIANSPRAADELRDEFVTMLDEFAAAR
jgi:hypothetical protein